MAEDGLLGRPVAAQVLLDAAVASRALLVAFVTHFVSSQSLFVAYLQVSLTFDMFFCRSVSVCSKSMLEVSLTFALQAGQLDRRRFLPARACLACRRIRSLVGLAFRHRGDYRGFCSRLIDVI